MRTNNFIINNRFLVNSSVRAVRDLENGDEIRLEPRLLDVLCLLSENNGKLLSRERLIKEIWNDYGGAEDGLNQAISFLRKVLKDSKKEIIETIPKKGYVLHASITFVEAPELEERSRLMDKKIYLKAAAIALLIFAVFFVASKTLIYRFSEQKIDTITEKNRNSFEANFSDLNIPNQETYLNTITTTGPDGKKYPLTAVGDKRPEFYINNRWIPEGKREEYSDLMDKMQRRLWVRQKIYNDSISSLAGGLLQR